MIQLELSLNEVNQILEALGEQPFKEVFQLIGKIQQQAGAQVQPPTTPGIPNQIQAKEDQ